jgi:L-fuculose-phosphate aldolase
MFLHLKAFEVRPDVGAVVHAHPPWCVALTLAGVSLADPVLPEIVLTLGRVVTAPYARPSSPDGAGAIAGPIRYGDAVLLDRHGSVTVGATLTEAYNVLETVEHSARIIAAARQMGAVTPLPEAEVAALTELGLAKGFLKKLPE